MQLQQHVVHVVLLDVGEDRGEAVVDHLLGHQLYAVSDQLVLHQEYYGYHGEQLGLARAEFRDK